jgi:hypothetical protein
VGEVEIEGLHVISNLISTSRSSSPRIPQTQDSTSYMEVFGRCHVGEELDPSLSTVVENVCLILRRISDLSSEGRHSICRFSTLHDD